MTARPAGAPPRLSDQDLVRMMSLMKGSDSVELKLTVPVASHRATIANLPLDPVEAQPRQVYFLETPDLALDKAGIVARARRFAGGRGDAVIKLRPVVPNELPSDIRRSASFNVELDALPGGFVCSGTMKSRTTGQDVLAAVSGTAPLRKLFTKEQRLFFKTHGPDGITLDDLTVLGPTFVLKGVFEPPELKRRFVAEMWLYPDGSRILELSTKCLPAEAFQVAAESRSYLAGKGVNLTGAQQTKTRTALRYFQGELKRTAPAPRKPRTAAAGRATTTRRAPATARATAATNRAAAATSAAAPSATATTKTAAKTPAKARTTKAKATTRTPRKTPAKPA